MISIRSHIQKFRRRNLRRFWSTRRHYATKRDWLISFYNRVLLSLPGWPLPWRKAMRRVCLRGIQAPLYVRLGTSDWYVLEEVFLDKVYEPINQRQPPEVRHIVDLGANTGFTIRLWQTLYPGARIVAVEPDDENLRMCKYNTAESSGPDRLVMVQACAAGSARSVFLDRSAGAWRFSMRDLDHSRTEGVAALTLPQILESWGADVPIDLLKCDIEGAEAEVFADCSAWIGRVKNMVVELHQPYSSERFLEDVRRGGAQFEVYHHTALEGQAELIFLERTN